MWGRYRNQWTNKREAAIVSGLFAVLMTIVVYHLTGQIAIVTLRRLFTLTIMSVPFLMGVGHWIGTAQSRGYLRGVTEKIERQQPPVIYQPGSVPQLPSSSISHQEPIDVAT